MRDRRTASLLAIALAAASCTAAPAPTNTEPVITPAVSTAAPQPVPDTNGVIPRFTNDIWPAVSAYNGNPLQNGNEDRAYLKIIVRGIPFEAWRDLRQAVQSLGIVQEGGTNQVGIYRDENGLHIATADLVGLNASTATVQVCYTFTTTSSQPSENGHLMSSEATVELRKTDNWYVYSITNNHVVQGCPASPKA